MEMKLALIVLVGACSGSRSGSALTPPDYGVAACESHRIIKLFGGGNCGPGCTTNSPAVNAFPINGLAKHGDGECNPEGIQVLPHSLHGGGCGWGASLGLDKFGKLVGMRADGRAVCDSQQLAGAEFIARSGPSTTLTFTIANVRQLEATPPQKAREGYRIESGGQSMCDPIAANRARQELGMPPQSTYAVANAPTEADDGNSDLVIPILGPLYSNTVEAIDSGEKLFNLACASDALAKRSINEIVTDTDTDDKKLAALRMLTATYCNKPLTLRGMKIDWLTSDEPKKASLEARWLGRDTTCISEPRLTRLKLSNISPASLPDGLQPTKCLGGKCGTWPEWTIEVRADCKNTPPTCETSTDYDFESYIHIDDPKQMAYRKKQK